MQFDKLEELLIDVHGKTTAIEEHLKAMNGKLIKHDEQLTKDIPKRLGELEEFKAKASFVIAGVGFILGILLAEGARYLFS